METAQISPIGMVKRLVGQYLTVTVSLNPAYQYQLELFTNVNRVSDTYPFDFEDGKYSCTIKLNKSGFFKWSVRYRREGTKTWRWLKQTGVDKVNGTVQVDPSWLDEAIVYNVFVRFFKGMTRKGDEIIPPGEGGTFDDVKAYLSTLQQMGISVLYFNPIHLIGELHRKYNMLDQLPTYWQPGSPYSIKDYKSIDPELTYDKDSKNFLLSDPKQEFLDLIEAAHERGMHVVMDLVFNHTAHDFVFQRMRPEWYLYKDNITSLTDPYLYPEDMKSGKPWGDANHTMSPYDHGLWFDDAAQLNWEYRLPEGPNKPPKNPSLKEMWEYFKSIPKYWIDQFGIDGFRCDIAYKVPPDFWTACIAEAREDAQQKRNNLSNDVIFIAESFTDDLETLQNVGFSAVYGDFSNKLRRPIDLQGYLAYMYNIGSSCFPDQSKWFIFPEGHDFDRTPQKILGNDSGNSQQALLANKSRWLLTSTLPGLPLIFNGFEKVEWRPVNLFGYGAVDWQRDVDLKDYLALVNTIRNKIPALSLSADFIQLHTNQELNEVTQLTAYLRKKEDSLVLVVVNMDVYHQAGPAVVYLPQEFDRIYQLKDELTGKMYLRSGCSLTVVLEPGDGHVFTVTFL
jgi:glycosidase